MSALGKKKTDYPIDFVVIWVDGNDPAWQQEREQYLPERNRVSSASDNRTSRFRDWETMKYWFRAVEKYAPWVRTVHFVTWGHAPEWMNKECEKLHIVNHRDYIPEEYLPVFSSHPIELNLHRIEGLSEHFVYFCDDMILTAPVEPEDFFVNGLPCDSLEETPQALTGDYHSSGVMNSVNANDIMFASRHFDRIRNRKEHRNKWFSLKDPHALVKNAVLGILNDRSFFGFNIHHLPSAYRKQTLKEVWEKEPDLLYETCTHRFRSAADVSQCVFKFHQLLTGQFMPYNKRAFGIKYNVRSHMDRICEAIETKKYKSICFNDSPEADFESCKKRLLASFEKVLPEKSGFEL